MPLPVDSDARKRIPLASGVDDYFFDALIEVAKVSWEGNEKHNPGQPLHWAREKSTDHEDCIRRHTYDSKRSAGIARVKHLANRAWRSLATLQIAVEEMNAVASGNYCETNKDSDTRLEGPPTIYDKPDFEEYTGDYPWELDPDQRSC